MCVCVCRLKGYGVLLYKELSAKVANSNDLYCSKYFINDRKQNVKLTKRTKTETDAQQKTDN